MKFLAMHITNQKLRFDILIYGWKFTKYIYVTLSSLNVRILAWKKIDNFDPYNVLLAVATKVTLYIKWP